MNAVGSAVTMTTGGGIQVWLSSRIAGGDELVKANEYKRVQVRDNRKKRDNAIPDPPTRSTIQHIRTCYIYIYLYTNRLARLYPSKFRALARRLDPQSNTLD